MNSCTPNLPNVLGIQGLVCYVTTSNTKDLQFKTSSGHWNLWFKQILRTTPSQFETRLYRNRKALKGGVTVHFDLTKSRLDLFTKQTSMFQMLILHTWTLTVVSKSDLRIEKKSFSIQWRIQFQKLIAWKASIGNCQWLPFVFVCRSRNTAKYVFCLCNCWKPSLGIFCIRGVLRGFARCAGKSPEAVTRGVL